MSVRCRLGFHTTNPPMRGRWYPTWRCVRCNKDLRPEPMPSEQEDK